MIKVDRAFSEEILVQRINSQQHKEIDINYFQLGEYRSRDSHATYHSIKLYRSFASEKVGDVYLLKKIVVEDPSFADELSRNQLRVVGTPDRQIGDKLLKCEFHWKDNGKHYLAFENPAYGTLNQFLEEVNGEQLTELQIVFILKGILLALRQLHNQNIYHQNLKISTIAICENFEIKLHDLSFSKYKGNQIPLGRTGAVTSRYAIPSRRDLDRDGEIDIQAFGVILYYLVHGNFPFQKNKKASMSHSKSKIIKGLLQIWEKLIHETQQELTIEQILNYPVFSANASQEKNTPQGLLAKYSQYRESLIQSRKWGRKSDKTQIKLSDQLLQQARGDLKVEVIKVIREKESLTVVLSNQNVIKIRNKEVKQQKSLNKVQTDSKRYQSDTFKELNCTVTKFGIVNDTIFLRLSNDLICISFYQARKGNQSNEADQVLMILNYNRVNPSLIKLVANGKDRIFRNYQEGLTQVPDLIVYVKAVFEKMLEHSSISA